MDNTTRRADQARGITLIGGPGRLEWRAMFPNETRELSAGFTEDRRAGCTKRQSDGLQKRAAF